MLLENWEFVLANHVSHGCSRTDQQRKGKKRKENSHIKLNDFAFLV
jgi:hypothetical protein